jgi:hypothetical protein
MSTYNYKPGLGNAASYEVSGAPWVTGSVNCREGHGEQRLVFPRVTRWIEIQNGDSAGESAEPMRVGFTEKGILGTNFFEVSQTSGQLELKVSELWISGSDYVQVIAGLTSIETTSINNAAVSPSGSNWSGSLAALVG